MIIDLCVVPFGVGLSVSKYVAACHEIIEQANLPCELHAYGTNIQGEWDAVFQVVKQCHEKIHAMGAPESPPPSRPAPGPTETTMADKVNESQRRNWNS
ncbi:MAG: MTH1187 family thiamine-binding protein [Desulfotignum sp.]|nr:MTH1187 family thiamine-binding protein [Desulfotignum sp.]